jgi:sarcosine dehydrogenase
MTAFPTQARVVIIGGGIIGCSTAHHLAGLGWRDVVLLERAKLTSGSTHHAAGLVGQLRNNAGVTRLLKDSVDLYDRLESETGQATGWKMNGGLRLACTPDRLIEIERQATTARSFGLDMHVVGPDEARDLWPPMSIDDVIAAAYLPTDGQANPSDITQALVKGARAGGVRVFEDCPVTAIEIEGGRVAAVTTPEGRIACEIIVNCAGQWAAEVGRLAGVTVPLISVQHQYMITETMADVPRDLPTLRDPDRQIYFKEEVGGLVMGGYETNPKAWASDGIPAGFHFTLLESDWDHFEPLMEAALERVPALAEVGVKDLINGPEAFTPDGNFILGEAPETGGFFVGAGFNAFGIASAGGAGKALAEWIVGGEAPYDLWPVDIRRFGAPHGEAEWVQARTLELYSKHYSIAWPHEEHASGRPYRASPLYERLRAAGACFGEKMGWERANWFAAPGSTPRDEPTFGRGNWFDAVGDEHRAARERAVIIDQSSFAKFRIGGVDAEAALQWICAGDMSAAPGHVTYTQMLNRRGGIEGDVTVARVAADDFYVVTGTGFRTHDRAWIAANLGTDLDVRLQDVSEAFGTLSLMGPRSRDILGSVCDDDLADDAFPYMSVRTLRIGGASVRALRVTYVGELGWELHVDRDDLAAVFDAIVAAGGAHGLAHAGYRAIESLRLEKGYRAWGSDIGPDHTPLEAGLAWAVKLDTDVPFLGRDALEAAATQRPTKRLVCFTVDDPDVVLLGRETILCDGEAVGWLTSAGWGYTVGANIGYGYVSRSAGATADDLDDRSFALEVANRRVPCVYKRRPPYDPAGQRIRG